MPLNPALGAVLLTLVLGFAVAACGRAMPGPAGERLERGTALPPPDLAAPRR